MIYDGVGVSVRRPLEAQLVFEAWPKVGEASVQCISSVVDEHLRDELLHLAGLILAADLCPERVPPSKVHATPAEWYSLVKGGFERGMFEAVGEHEVVRAPCGAKT